ncbi:MurR/RpiR family transcriptional regulator [Nesterenkonia alkaliphila]|uniref:MurR/RpiR family transcriptional regulator n=1 Tax=Nesterenkonia alkaliphila TaxID=1463631 RepID=A0A7K1UL17_9MICC|nr:MurR/RpiR family transcriptional regulator [Nesterenkonia alkaliphila]MVT26701.1 MurR/RpiR family transcriptional regulator [Nesterenkonia alkaliphila]GFZ76865.1 rpiR family transcriptional regulator [Nesterenkonia alkaliphila]
MTRRIDARIENQYGDLPPQERRVADFLLEHLGDLAVFSAAEISRQTGVSKATVSRLFRKLGFDDFKEVRDHAMALRASGQPTAAPLLTGDSEATTGIQRHIQHEQANLARLAETLSGGRLNEVVELVAGAESVLIIGLRNSYPPAAHLHHQLIQLRSRVRLAPQPGQSIGEELAGLGLHEAVVVFGFRRRPRGFTELVQRTAASPAVLVLIGDATARRYAQHAQIWIECPLDADGAFDSYAAPMSLVSLLANGVLNAALPAGRRRISHVADTYDDLKELDL